MSVDAPLAKPVELKQVQKADDHAPTKAYTVGSYLSARLSQIGLKHHFAVAGDFNLVLLDQLLTNKDLQQVCCCNELNCGYSAERGCGRSHLQRRRTFRYQRDCRRLCREPAGHPGVRRTQFQRSRDGTSHTPHARDS
jgi:Thiamine pyrophosphate enzyme, N-terminal TPP binding domain